MAVATVFSQTGGGALQADSSTYTLGMQFTLSQPGTLTGIWFYSAAGAGSLPTGCCIYQMTGAGTGTQVSGSVNNSPSWSGAVGTGWIKCAYASGPVLAASTVYKVCVLKDAGNQEYSATAHYWDTGAGSGGLTNGPLSAPGNAGGDGGQDTFVTPSAALAYPASSFNAANYWVDVEVTYTPAAAGAVILGAPADDEMSWSKLCLLGVTR